MNKRKVLLWVAVVCLLAMLLPATVMADSLDGWQKNEADGTWSYYDDGSKYVDGVFYISENGAYYCFDAEGIMVANDWYQDEYNQYWYYCGANGAVYQEGVYYIEGQYFGFDYSGAMYADQDFEMYDNDDEKWYYYTATADGSLIVSKWVQNSEGYYYYYGADGARYSRGVYNIGGKYYGFDYDGTMFAGRDFELYDYEAERWCYYTASADGSLIISKWVQDSEGYYYYYGPNGEKYSRDSYAIGGKYYYFDYDGRMLDDATIGNGYYDETQEIYVFEYYRAKKGGALYVNEWYQDGNYWYYYGAEGVGVDDFAKVGNTWYFFYDARMVEDQIVYSNKYQADYYIAPGGASYTKVPTTGWLETGRGYYYYYNGERYRDGVYKIGNKYYAFDDSGVMYEDCSVNFDQYNEATGEWTYKYYRAKSGGALYVNEWYEDSYGEWWYYGADAAAVEEDFVKINGKWYFFEDHCMVKDTLVYSQTYGAYYVINAAGDGYKGLGNGWVKIAGNYYYATNGIPCTSKVLKIDGKYYGFSDSGIMFDDESFFVDWYDNDMGYWVGGSYRAKAGGALYVNEWYEDTYGNWYYYGADGAGMQDFVQLKGVWYFFEDGRMVTDKLVYSYQYEGLYVISKDGKSYTEVTKDGWVDVSGTYYYIKNGMLYTYGIYSIDGAYYAFNYNGEMYNDVAFEMEDYESGGWYYYCAKAGGKLYVNEWRKTGGEYFYYGEGGKAPRNELRTINGATYGFSYEGRMYHETWEYFDGGYRLFGEDGKMIATEGKYAINGNYYYVQADGTLFDSGWKEISGKWYYFNVAMYANSLQRIDGNLYAIDNAGVCNKVTGDGVYDIGTQGKVYLKNGEITSGWQKIGTDWYYFDSSMVRDQVTYAEDGYYAFDKDGKLFKGGWIAFNEDSYYEYSMCRYAYADASGKVKTGLQTIGGKQYLFDDYGYTYYNATVRINGVDYVVNESGLVVSSSGGNGWKQIDGKYFYYENGKMVKGDYRKIDGKLYYFEYDGAMATNRIVYDYSDNGVLVGANGAAVTGWAQYNGSWYYADAEYQLVYGKRTINGKNYIFRNALAIGSFIWNGKIVTTDSSGAIISEKDMNDGWNYVDGSALYVKNGEPYNGWVGDYLIRDGYMAVNDYYSWNGDYYAFDVYGKHVKSGWHQFSYGDNSYSQYVYVKSDGKLCVNEWYKINGVSYYFDGVYMLSGGIYEVGGELYKFADDGKYLGKATGLNGEGWKQEDGKWYYIHAGEPVTGIQWISKKDSIKRYAFGYDGAMIKNEFFYDGAYYYIDSNGVVANYTGWKKLNGKWCYFNNSNVAITGWFQDNGKVYHGRVEIADEDYSATVAIVTGYQYIEGEVYYFDANGVCQGAKNITSGWFNGGGDWYYFRNGEAVTGLQNVGGNNYYFAGGVMVTNDIYSGRYFGSNGVQRTTKGWYKTEFGWIYVKDNGRLADGIQKIGGKEYYFSNHVMVR